MVRASGGRAAFKALVLGTNAQGQLLTVLRLDGKGNGNPFVIRMSEVMA